MELSQAYVRKPDLFAADVAGERVLMSVEQGEYFGLGGVGGRIFDLLADPCSLEQLTTTIVAEYGADPAVCENDIRHFLGQMLDQGLIAPV